MPRRDDLDRVLVIGSGPIVIGQACEFDYSGTQACKALVEEGIFVVLVNSNPATIMTDPDTADRTYIEPVTANVLEQIIIAEKPRAILPTIGGQTALNLVLEAAAAGLFARHGVELIGAGIEAIKRAEDRDRFKKIVQQVGLDVPRSDVAGTLSEARKIVDRIGMPVIVRPSRTLGGSGGSLAFSEAQLEDNVARGLGTSPISQVLIEESIAGWKEFELEVMRDGRDNVVVVCSIENLDPMGIHTGDSITVAPAQTLSDKEFQAMRDAAASIIRAVGVDTGGANIQFAVNPRNGRMVVIEMNPRVSRSSALASKATGFPIAKIAAKLAIGYCLDELRNDITETTAASFEPSIDYVVTKIPRFAFEKFPGSKPDLGPQMQSVGEAMAIGRTFKESLQKGLRSLETGRHGLADHGDLSCDDIERRLASGDALRLELLGEAFRRGKSLETVHAITQIDPWFLREIMELIATEAVLSRTHLEDIAEDDLWRLKRDGFSDRRIAELVRSSEIEVRRRRRLAGVRPVFKAVDTCGAEFEAKTPYLYSSYERGEDESPRLSRSKILILGSGPNRIGQGIEFDYCCVHASLALRDHGYETLMLNCNPETVSTDYDTSDSLFFEPLTLEDVIEVLDREKPQGIIVQFGGQTPLSLARGLEQAGARIIGTSTDAIDRTEDRARFDLLLSKLNLRRPKNGIARSKEDAVKVAQEIGYPILLRPSYVLGGRGMEIIHDEQDFQRHMDLALQASPEHPVLIDEFLEDAIELDVDAVSDGRRVVIGAIMEHIERAGIHSGDSSCSLPPYSIDREIQGDIRDQTISLAQEIGVVGLMNAQFAIKRDQIYVLEVNPRASRTIPFVSKAIGRPLAKIAALCMTGLSLESQGVHQDFSPHGINVKQSVFPFIKFPGVDITLGPEMKSTGEVMGIDASFGAAFGKAQIAAGASLPTRGRALISVPSSWKLPIVPIARRLERLGFDLVATEGTAQRLRRSGLRAASVNKVHQGPPHTVDLIRGGSISLVINAPSGPQSFRDSMPVRRAALESEVPYFTTIAAASAAADAIALRLSLNQERVLPLQLRPGI